MKNLRHLFQILVYIFGTINLVFSQVQFGDEANFNIRNSVDFISTTSFALEQNDLEKTNAFMANSKTRFEENKGQVTGEDAQKVKYFLNLKQMSVFLLDAGISYQFNKIHYPEGYNITNKYGSHAEQEKQEFLAKEICFETYRMDIILKGANPSPIITCEEKCDDFTNYYNRNVLNVYSYGKVIYHNIYPNIDWIIYSKGEDLKYDFIVHPGGNPNDIVLETKWVEDLKLNSDGDLILKNRIGNLKEERPISYQEKKEIKTSFVISDNEIRFNLQNYDPNKELVIDPLVRLWGTYYGGFGYEVGFSCAVDGSNNVYLAGETYSNTQIASGGYQNNLQGNQDLFVVKFNTNGVRQWATYYGGENTDSRPYLAVDITGNVYLSGYSNSTIGIASGGHQNTFAGGASDSFLVKFNNNGVRQWATYYGGPDIDPGIQCAVDNSGNVYLSGLTYSTSGIASGGHQNTFSGGDFDAYLVKFNASGVRQWGTYYGGPGMEQRSGCSVDGSGNVYLSGETDSNTGIANGGHQNTRNGLSDSYLVKFDANGVRQWGTYYGGSGFDYGESCTVDLSGNVYLTGFTFSTTSIASGGHQNTFGGGSETDAFLVKFNSAGVRQWGTYYGGNDMDRAIHCKTDVNGNIYMSGFTLSSSSIASGGYQNNLGGNFDAFLVSFNSAGVRQWGSYYGSIDYEHGYSCAIDNCSNVYLAGITSSSVAIANGGHQNTYAGGNDGYLVKFATVVDSNTTSLTPICENEIKLLTTSGLGTGTWSIENGGGTIIAGPAYQPGNINSPTSVTIRYTSDACGTATEVTFIVNPTPEAGVLSGIQNICVGLTTTFSSTQIGGIWSISDTGIASIDSVTGVITGVSSGTTTISYTVAGVGSCPDAIATSTITVVGSSSSLSLSGPQTMCVGSIINLNSNQSGGTWSTSDPGISTVNGSTGVIEGVGVGTSTITYTISGSGSGACPDATATSTITVIDSVTAGTLSGSQTICSGSTVIFNSTELGGTWSTSNSGIATVDISTGEVTGVSAGTAIITYTVVSSGACPNATATRSITVTASTSAGVLSGTQLICIGSTILFTSTEIGGTWSSSNPGVAIVDMTTGEVTGISSGTATITYTVLGTGGCPDATATRTVTVSAPPFPGILSGTQSLCIGSTTTFSSTQSGGTWSTSNASVATINSLTGEVTGVGPGTAIVTYTVTGMCSATDQLSIEIFPVLELSISNDTTICRDETVSIWVEAIGGTGNYTLLWDNNLSSQYNFNVTPTATTVYTATVDDGCTVLQEAVTVSIEEVPDPSFSADVLMGCVPFNVELTNLSLPGSTQCEWKIDNGFYSDDCTNVNTLITEPGCIDITLKLTSQSGCSDSVTYVDYICGEAVPVAEIVANPTIISALDTEVDFINFSSGATNYDWSFGDGTENSHEFEPTHNFPDQSSGSFMTTLIATTDFGCSDTATVIIEVKEELLFYLPNSFTPDASGTNDVWKPTFNSGYDPMSLNLYIYNRWGELIWESHNADVGWDGTYGGNTVQAGTYTWKMDFKHADKTKHFSYIGHLNLLK